jgi:hypothetical protein
MALADRHLEAHEYAQGDQAAKMMKWGPPIELILCGSSNTAIPTCGWDRVVSRAAGSGRLSLAALLHNNHLKRHQLPRWPASWSHLDTLAGAAP